MSWRLAISAALWTAALGLLLGMPFAVYAQEPNFTPLPLQASCVLPTEAEKALCRPDAKRLCALSIPLGVFAVLDCFKANRAQLSKGCADLLAGCGQ
jgi:hypothetical protein